MPRGAVLHTVQPHVYTRFVDEKAALIEKGLPLPVKAFQVGGSWWAFDGHHTFAAYVFLDRAPVLAVFELDEKGDTIEPPKLFLGG